MIPVSPVIPHAHLPEVVFGAGQPEYSPLPMVLFQSSTGHYISRWKLTWRERVRLLCSGSLFISVLTFGHRLQPILPATTPPEALTGALAQFNAEAEQL